MKVTAPDCSETQKPVASVREDRDLVPPTANYTAQLNCCENKLNYQEFFC